MLYVQHVIKASELKAWVKSWDNKKYLQYWENKLGRPLGLEKEVLNESVDIVKEFEVASDENYYDALLSIVDPAMLETYFRHDHSSIKVANFYEGLLQPADLETKKKLIKGYDFEHRDIGRVIINKDGEPIGTIGEKSDLFWLVFYHDFIVEEEEGTVTIPKHTHEHEDYLTIQIWNADEISPDNLDKYIQEILYNCAVNLGLSFRMAKINPLYKEKGVNGEYILDFEYKNFEDIPLLYFNATFEDISARIKFLSYYQVVEYYYVRANNQLFTQLLIDEGICNPTSFNPKVLSKLIKEYSKGKKEREAVKLVLKKAIDVDEFKSWVQAEQSRKTTYTSNEDLEIKKLNIDLSMDDDKIISALSDRIYTLRCSIVHSKADIDEMMIIPNLNDSRLIDEIPLMSYVASKVLETWGKLNN